MCYLPSDEDCLNGFPNHPVVYVTWHDAVAYGNWLTTRLRSWTDTPRPLARLIREGAHATLPSEAEWEKAARGTDGRHYPWGHEADAKRPNYSRTGIESTSTVGCFPEGVSPYGLQDMSGNVWEWTRSVWQKEGYPYPEDQPGRRRREDLQLSDLLARVLRGGSSFFFPGGARCAFRLGDDSRNAHHVIGFRVVVSVLPCL